MRRLIAGGIVAVLVLAMMAPSLAATTNAANDKTELVDQVRFLDRGDTAVYVDQVGETNALLVDSSEKYTANSAVLKVDTMRNLPLQTDGLASNKKWRAPHLGERG